MSADPRLQTWVCPACGAALVKLDEYQTCM
jgi:hypothetical protein